MNTTHPPQRIYRKRPTPWPIRVFLVVAILFGIWADVSSDFSASADNSGANPASKTPLLGLADDHSYLADLVRTLAARR